jgi:hypothetical protein
MITALTNRSTSKALGYVILAVLLAGSVVLVRRALRQMALKERHPHEPWLWDHSWRHELIDEQLSNVLLGLPIFGFLSLLLALFTFAVFTGRVEDDPLNLTVYRVVLVIAGGAFVWTMLIPYARQVLALLRFGRMRLCLPGIPLALGSRCQVLLVARRSLAPLQHLRVTLRRVREREEVRGSGKNKKRVTVRDVEYERAHQVDAQALRDGKPLPIQLNVPRAKLEDSTVLSQAPRCHWELQLTSEVPGVDLDTTFILPVYAVRRGPPPKP